MTSENRLDALCDAIAADLAAGVFNVAISPEVILWPETDMKDTSLHVFVLGSKAEAEADTRGEDEETFEVDIGIVRRLQLPPGRPIARGDVAPYRQLAQMLFDHFGPRGGQRYKLDDPAVFCTAVAFAPGVESGSVWQALRDARTFLSVVRATFMAGD
jgi:hypothetical protein